MAKCAHKTFDRAGIVEMPGNFIGTQRPIPDAIGLQAMSALISVANSLCPGQEKRTMREAEVQIRNSV